MRSYVALAGRYLKHQRRKSILTVIGIILSVALISSLGTMAQAVKDNLILNTKYTDGSFYFGYSKPTPELYDTLRNNVLIDQLGVYRKGTATPLKSSSTVEVGSLDKNGFELLPVHLHQGRLPAAADEAVVETWILENLPGAPKLNGTTELNGPDGKPRTYRIVGLLNNEKSSQLSGQSRAYTLESASNIAIDSNALLVLTLRNGVDVTDQLDDFTKLNDSLFTNTELLSLMGEAPDNNLNQSLAIIFGTLIGLVVLSTVAVIYNAFHIAVLERIRQFGLLRTLGASPGQIRNLVFREATVIAAVGVPIGLIVGWFGLALVLWLMTQGGLKILTMEQFHITFHWWIMGGSLIVGFLAVYLAAWLPARKASSVSPVEAAKGAGSIVRESYRRAKIPSLLSLMGVEGRMASNNIRRNRTKFRITTFSIIISIVLFIVFHYFTQQALNMTTTTNEDDRIAFQFNRIQGSVVPQTGDFLSDDELRELAQVPGVEGVYGKYHELIAQTLVSDREFNPDISKRTDMNYELTEWKGETNKTVSTRIELYDGARLEEAKSYLESGTIDPAKLANGDGVLLIQTIKPYNRSGKKAIMPLTRYKIGDKMKLWLNSKQGSEEKIVREVTVAGVLNQSPFDSPYQGNMLTVIVGKPAFASLLEAAPGQYPPSKYQASRFGIEIALKDRADPEPVRMKLQQMKRDIPDSSLVDIAEQQSMTRNFNVQMQIFVYGFILIIGVIGSLNIINTVQTNLLLRRKEIGLLQAVGMTMGQIRKMASAEGMWFGVIGSFWGILLGVGLCYLLFKQMSSVQGFPFEFPWGGALIASGVALLVGLLSVQGPLRRMEKANLLEELREEA
ncbi:ABC transporter permease [Cohnella cholangitidis]|uniref:ABC transporter permease n=1 Tax=Cohnella cholangitidis TaxID=2598458 RepID=A0A7G5BZB8_9BACL|nr:ABC transporter permease [Cohnella cholangitidis]QMV42302.1 ABC transporter permease [Cohnella cholangitidis]